MAAKAKTETKTYRPSDLAKELNVDAKRIRAYLRSEHSRSAEAKNTNWELTEAQATAIRERFTKSEKDEQDS